jgi:hypothetical protein
MPLPGGGGGGGRGVIKFKEICRQVVRVKKVYLINDYLISAATADVLLQRVEHCIKGPVCSVTSQIDLGSLENR